MCVVKTLNISLNDEDYERVQSVKQNLGVTWAEFVTVAAEELDEEE